MVPPTRIFHCANGHQICQTCKYIETCKETNHLHFFTRSKMNQPMCPKCRKKIIGRATDMENFLKVGLTSKDHKLIPIDHLLSLWIYRNFYPILARHQNSASFLWRTFVTFSFWSLKKKHKIHTLYIPRDIDFLHYEQKMSGPFQCDGMWISRWSVYCGPFYVCWVGVS